MLLLSFNVTTDSSTPTSTTGPVPLISLYNGINVPIDTRLIILGLIDTNNNLITAVRKIIS